MVSSSSSPSSSLTLSWSSMDQKKKQQAKRKKTREVVNQTRSTTIALCGGVGDIEDFCKEDTLEIRSSLLCWYDQNQRVFPWRKQTTEIESYNDDKEDESCDRAYAVWVSEVMLQQTRVATVIDYYNRWMEKWPTINHLAQASQEEVNQMWAGLGYYRRARFLLEGAKMIVEKGGEFPQTVSTLRKIKGIGDYTAGAIASIAFYEAVPVVDGNVIRVIARLKAISANPKESTTIKIFWKLAGQLVDACRPGDFNQALMELGATICSPTSPGCSICPVAGQCRALQLCQSHKLESVTDYPAKVVKLKQRLDFWAVCVVEILEHNNVDIQKESNEKNKFLFVKRPDEGLLAGLWEFPSVSLKGEANLATRRQMMDKYLKNFFKLNTDECTIVSREDIGECVHIFTHIRLKMFVELIVLHQKGGGRVFHAKKEDISAWKYVDGDSIDSMGLTSGVRKVYNMIQQCKREQSLENQPRRTRKRSRRS
ncbi:hypothetical protein Scep_023693 [Stephania cephalantha]|uniref:Adenine DNA glycosylase n=1 Tax=Stephania cephalantha TaxID=152367 RepID=A0AAP0F0K6_9MAGN